LSGTRPNAWSAAKSASTRCNGSDAARQATPARSLKGRKAFVPSRNSSSSTAITPKGVWQWSFFAAAADVRRLPCLRRAFLDAAPRPFGQRLVAHLPQFLDHPALGRVGLSQVAPCVFRHPQQAFKACPQQRMAVDALQQDSISFGERRHGRLLRMGVGRNRLQILYRASL